MTNSLLTGPGSRFTIGVIILLFVSLYGLYLLIAALTKNPITIKGITLSLRFQFVLALLLQIPLVIYIWLGFYTKILS